MALSDIQDTFGVDLSGGSLGTITLETMNQTDVSDVAALVKKNRSRGKSRQAIDDVEPTLQGLDSKRPKKGWTLIQKSKALTYSKPCDLCSEKDTNPDPVQPTLNRLWGEYREKNGVLCCDASSCWYCLRVWNAKHKKLLTLGKYKEEVGKDPDKFAVHEKYMFWIIMKVTEQFELTGDRELMVRLTWPEPWKLLTLEILQVKWIMPEEVFQDFEEYPALTIWIGVVNSCVGSVSLSQPNLRIYVTCINNY